MSDESDMVYVVQVRHKKTGGWLYVGSVSKDIRFTTSYYDTPVDAAVSAQKFIQEFVESFNSNSFRSDSDLAKLANIDDYTYIVESFPRKDMMMLKLRG